MIIKFLDGYLETVNSYNNMMPVDVFTGMLHIKDIFMIGHVQICF